MPVIMPAPGAASSYSRAPAMGKQLQERRARIEQPLDALARQQLATGQMFVAGLFIPTKAGSGDLLTQVCHQSCACTSGFARIAQSDSSLVSMTGMGGYASFALI